MVSNAPLKWLQGDNPHMNRRERIIAELDPVTAIKEFTLLMIMIIILLVILGMMGVPVFGLKLLI